MHIFRSSEGAAIYISKANYQFDNWVYSLLAFREGPTGALKYIDQLNFGAEKLDITADTHPYVFKAIAHKLVYEPAILKNQLNFVELKKMPNNGISQIQDLIDKHQIDENVFFTYNPWIQARKKRFAKNLAFTYFIPATSIAQKPVVDTTPSEDVPVLQESTQPNYPRFPKAIHYSTINKSFFAVFTFKADLHYEEDFILYGGESPLTVIAS